MINRLLIGTLVAVLAAFALVTLYDYSSQPTDENLFASLPSPYLVGPHAPKWIGAWGILQPRSSIPGQNSSADTLHPGDILSRINGRSIGDLPSLGPLLAAIPADSTVRLAFHRPSVRLSGTFDVRRSMLSESLFVRLGGGVVVTAVQPGGASDLAGMKVGDIIVRINGTTFSSPAEADANMRRAQSDRTIRYDVLRGLEPVSLNVRLVRFGLSLSMLSFFLGGMVLLGTGAFIALKRARLFAARILGLSYLLLGFAVCVVLIRREPDVTWFVAVRWAFLDAAVFLGVATAWHASLIFPNEWTAILSRRWPLRTMYGLATVLVLLGAIVSALGGMRGALELLLFGGGALLLLLVGKVIRLMFRKSVTPEMRAQRIYIKVASIIVNAGSVLLVVWLLSTDHVDQIGFQGLLLIAMPVATFYTIARFQLLDLRLHIRRTIQYSLASVGWQIMIISFALTVVASIISLQISLPVVTIRGTSVEVRDAGVQSAPVSDTERVLFLGVGILAWMGLSLARRGGQRIIDRYYDRHQYDYRRALSDVATTLSTNLSLTGLGHALADRLVHLMHLKGAAVFFYRDEDACCCAEAVGVDQEQWAQICLGDRDSLARAVKGFQGVISLDYLPEELKETYRQRDARALLPVRSKEKLIAVLALGEKLSEAAYSREDLEFLSAVANQASVAIENAFLYEELAEQERLKHELSIARRIQLASLPQKTPNIVGLDLAGKSVPAMEVGGDFFDYLGGGDGRLTVIIGDVSGKGTSAALYMAKVQGIFRSLFDVVTSLRQLMTKANHLLYGDLERSSYITALAAVFDPAQASMRVARAGHLPLYRWSAADGTVECLQPKGLGLGLQDGDLFSTEMGEATIVTRAGDLFVFVSDGITEARNEAGDEYGEERLFQVMRACATERAETVLQRILDTVAAHVGSAPQHDDETAVVVRITH